MCLFSLFISGHQPKFALVAYEQFEEERRKRAYSLNLTPRYQESASRIPGRNSVFNLVWKGMLCLSVDACQDVRRCAGHVVDMMHVKMLLFPSIQGVVETILDAPCTNKVEELTNGVRRFSISSTLQLESTSSQSSKKKYKHHDLVFPAVFVPSLFFEYSSEYFSEPQMRIPEIDDPGSVAFLQRSQRKKRNDTMLEEYTDEVEECLRGRVSVEKFRVETNAEGVAWHPFETWIVSWNETRVQYVFFPV